MIHVIKMQIDKETKGTIRYTASFKTQDDVAATCIYIRKAALQKENSVGWPKNITITVDTS